MSRSLAWANWSLNVLTGLLIFVGGSCIYMPETAYRVTTSVVSAEPVKLEPDGSLPAMTDEQLARIDTEPFKGVGQ
jgi:hypothetical protein